MINEQHVKAFCSGLIEDIENYDKAMLDDIHTWDCHHRNEIINGKEISSKELKDKGLYYNRPSSELIFLPREEHMSIHIKIRNIGNAYFKNKKHTDEAKLKNSLAHRGQESGFKGHHHTEHSKKLLADSHRGKQMSDKAKEKISKKISILKRGNTNVRGMKWFNNGTKNIRAFVCPDGFVAGRLPKNKNGNDKC